MTFETLDIPIKSLKRNTGQIPGVPKNPRIIKDNNFKKLKDSIVQDPEMLELREIIAYKQGDEYIIIGGNMRFEALKALNFEKAKCKVITGETTPEQLKRIILKDNSAYGEWDFDELANEWDEALIRACAIDVPMPFDEEDVEKAQEEKAQEEKKEEPEEVIEPVKEDLPFEEDLPFPLPTFRFEITGQVNIDKVKQFLDFSEITYKEI